MARARKGESSDSGAASAVGRYGREFEALAEALLRGECVLFAGAGVSAAALPDWAQLVDLLSQALSDLQARGARPDDFVDIAQWYVEEYGRERLLRELVRVYGAPNLPSTPLADAVAALPASLFFTTNYDRVLETALRGRGVLPDVIVDDRHVALIDERNRATVVKLHGSIAEPASVVLTREDYSTYAETHRAAITYLQSLLATRTFLFVGFSFADPNFRLIYDAIQRALGRYRRWAYALILDPRNPLMLRYWERRGVHMLTFPRGRGEDETVRFVQALGQEVRARQSEAGLPHLLARLADGQTPPALPQAAELGRLLAQGADLVGEMLAEVERSGGGKAAEMLRLATTLADVGLEIDADEWARLGDVLLGRDEAGLAVRAYGAALRQRARGPAEGKIDPRLVQNLARAYLGSGDPARAAALLGELVLRPTPEGQELDQEWLRRRPDDLARLVLAQAAAAVDLLDAGHEVEARERLAATRRLLDLATQRRLLRGADRTLLRQARQALAAAEDK